MPERKTMMSISRITDDDTGMYLMGEIDGSFPEEELEKYIDTYGGYGFNELVTKLSFLQFQVWKAWRKHCGKKYCGCAAEGVKNV